MRVAVPLPIALSRALLAGFVASIAMLVAFAVAFVLALVLGSLPLGFLAEWCRGLTSNSLIDGAKPNLYAATAIFFVGGLLWAVVYALTFQSRLHGPEWQRGATFAVVPWMFSLAVFLPLVSGGVFGLALGAGPLPVVGNLILHAVYGSVLGAAYGPGGDAVVDASLHSPDGDDLWASPSAQQGAAVGLVVGLGAGVAVGLLAALLSGQGTTTNPLSLAVATTLAGGAFGGMIGSLLAAGAYQR